VTQRPQNDPRGIAVVTAAAAPAAIGPYSQAIRANGLLFTAGQIPLDPDSMTLVPGGISEQTERVMLNLEAILREAGCELASVIKSTCFLTNLDDFQAFNTVYAAHFGAHKPARSTVQVARLPAGALVEVECVAVCP
jgi:2-iminobutanoate/2-iminopropanoate deaminase